MYRVVLYCNVLYVHALMFGLNFKMCLEMQVGKYQPPISEMSQTSVLVSWLNVRNGKFPYHWMRKQFQKVEWLKTTLGESGRCRTSGNIF